MEESDSTEEGTAIRATDKGKRTEKTAQLPAGRQTVAEAVSEEEIERHGTIRKVEMIMKKTIFEEMGGTYIRHGDYFIPCLTLPEEEELRFVGVWGQRHLWYLKEYRRNVYLELLMNGRLNSYLAVRNRTWIDVQLLSGQGSIDLCRVGDILGPYFKRSG